MHHKTGLQSRPRARGGKSERESGFLLLLSLLLVVLAVLSCCSSILSCHFYCLVALSVVGRNAERTVRVGHSQRTKVENACALEFCCRFCHGLCLCLSRCRCLCRRPSHAHTHTHANRAALCDVLSLRSRPGCLCLSPSHSPPSATASASTPPSHSAFLPCLRSINLRPFGLHLFAFG